MIINNFIKKYGKNLSWHGPRKQKVEIYKAKRRLDCCSDLWKNNKLAEVKQAIKKFLDIIYFVMIITCNNDGQIKTLNLIRNISRKLIKFIMQTCFPTSYVQKDLLIKSGCFNDTSGQIMV